jgi:hypothetical protein
VANAEAAELVAGDASDLAAAGLPDSQADGDAPASPDDPVATGVAAEVAANENATPLAARPTVRPSVSLLGADDLARMATSLLPLAVRLHRDVPSNGRAAALAALDQFIAQPSPTGFLRAARELRGAIAAHRFAHSSRVLSERAFGRALTRLHDTAILDEERRGLLASLPVDVRAARRLDALAALLQAHDELAARVRVPQKYKLEPLPPEPKARHAAARSSPPKKRRRR